MKKINSLLAIMSLFTILSACAINKVNAQTVTAEQVVPPATNSSMIIGFQNTPITGSIGTGSYIVGHKNTGTGTYLTVVGYDNSVTTTQSATVFGKNNTVTNGYTSTAIGYRNTVSSGEAVAFGRENVSSGPNTSTFGISNQSSGYQSMTFGLKNVGSQYQSCAFGARNNAAGQYANAFGTRNAAQGDYSGAYGYRNTANAVNSYVFGQMMTNNIPNSVMVGVNDNAKITILNNGNVGIGTTDTKGYMLAVAGNAIAQEVVVKLQAQWPDYVFDSAYNLPPLTQVEQYINTNNHLPGIPSAKETAQQGISLGNNQALLLKKIEELTLYMIEQNKQVATQQQQIVQQNKLLQAQQELLLQLQKELDILKQENK